MTLFKLNNFEEIDFNTWEEKLKKDLRGLPEEGNLIKTNDFENLNFKSYSHSSQVNDSIIRGRRNKTNDWGIEFSSENIDPKSNNKKLLTALNSGATALRIDVSGKTLVDLKEILKDVVVDAITLFIYVKNQEQLKEISKYLNSKNIFFAISSNIEELQFSSKSNFLSSYDYFAQGANSATEIAFLLFKIQQIFEHGIEKNVSKDVIFNSLHFELGISDNYFIQIAKNRVFRQLANLVISQYNQDLTNKDIFIRSRVGFINKSLQDPHTNLLRQTTEVMSAAISGADAILCEPFDKFSLNGRSDFSERMALNISLILKHESYLDKVSDSTGGAYSVENLCDALADNAWSLFLELSSFELEKEVNDKLNHEIEISKLKKIENFKSGKNILIGINKYQLKEKNDNSWDKKRLPESYLILENEI